MHYHDITKDDMKNGDGLRVVLWLSGCEHKCPGCHNPVTWDPDDGLIFDDAAKQEIFGQLREPYIDGITFSGGDPLFHENLIEVQEFVKEIHEMFPEKTVWLYTGYRWEDVGPLPVMEYVDVLVDGKFEADKADNKLMWKGSSNQRVIDVQATLKAADPLKPVLHCNDYM